LVNVSILWWGELPVCSDKLYISMKFEICLSLCRLLLKKEGGQCLHAGQQIFLMRIFYFQKHNAQFFFLELVTYITLSWFNVDVTFKVHFILLQVKKAQFGHFRKHGVNPKKKMKSFLVTRNALLHPGKKAIDMIDKKSWNVSD